MSEKVNMEAILKAIPDRYKLVVAATQRARALNLGAPALVESKLKNNAIIALAEMATGKTKVISKPVSKSEEKDSKKEK